MKDKNGIEMKTGDIVEIRNAYFKNDNGIYFVRHTPGDASWSGGDYSLKKMCRNGKLSTAKGAIAFWPLSAFTNNRLKNAECKEWNKANATIEIIYNIDNSHVIEFFKELAERNKKQAERDAMHYGEDNRSTILYKTLYSSYIEVVTRMEAKEELKQITLQESKPVEQPEAKTGPQQIERKYFPINEQLAKSARSMWSFDSYAPNSTTEDYRREVNKVYDLVEKVAISKSNRLSEALTLAERYSKKYAEWINKSNNIEMMCPSVMISGAGNFPTNKKIKQNNARDKHFKDLEYINSYFKKIENLLYGQEIIKSSDSEVIEKLQEKLDTLEKLQTTMKEANAYYKKNNTLQGFPQLAQKEIDSIADFMKRNPCHARPFESYSLTNNNAKIKSTKERIERLLRAKEAGTKEVDSGICKVVENSEIMRIQLIFDGKPSEDIRNILKANGFKWAPSQKAWQRQLTENGKYATKKVMEKLKQIA